MSIDSPTMKRLALIKFLFNSAVSRSYLPSPLNGLAILCMHDSIELFLQLAMEWLNAGSGNPSFMEYFEIIDKKLVPNELQQKEAIRRLNKARTALKHSGILPCDLDIEAYRASATNFFEDNTNIIFKISFDEISLVELVTPESVRLKLQKAYEAKTQGDISSALVKIALAFDELIFDYEKRKIMNSNSPFFLGSDFTHYSSYFMGVESSTGQFKKFVDDVQKAMISMQSAIKILALGFDYRKYVKFKYLTPEVFHTFPDVTVRLTRDSSKMSEDDFDFLMAFVIESSLRLRDFDYTL